MGVEEQAVLGTVLVLGVVMASLAWWNLDHKRKPSVFFEGRKPVSRKPTATAAKPSASATKPKASATKHKPACSYTTDLTELAEKGEVDEVVGREKQIEQVIRILGRRRKSNPCLIGEAGVGKTAIAEGLALKIARNQVPEALRNKRVLALDPALLVAGASLLGQFESRIKVMLDQISSREDVILFIDEIHTLVGLGRGMNNTLDAAEILKPALARGHLHCIGATTRNEYTRYIEKDQALERRFQPVVVPESTVAETCQILNNVCKLYEAHHHVRYTADALLAASTLSSRYITDRFLPDKAIDLVDEAGSEARLCRREVVTEADMRSLISSRTGIPLEDVSADESACLLKFEEAIRSSVVGQEEAVVAVSNAMRRARAGFKNPDRPSSFIFYGPTGVGKTELAKALALHYMGSKEAMLRLDMSEYMERHSVSKLIGSPPGYVGSEIKGVLSEPVRRRPHTVVLFDEIEKAHRDIDNLLLQILEDGRLTDAKGVSVDFRNTIVILTSNVGSRAIVNGGERSEEEMEKLAEQELRGCFRPELLNRLDEMIVFKQLTRGEVRQIGDMMVGVVVERAKAARKIEVQVTERCRERVVEEGLNPSYGARPIRRAITMLLENNLARKMLGGEIVEGDSVVVDVDADGQILIKTLKK